MKFLDLFAGIGGFRLGMQQAGHECVGYVEWDKFARKSYEAIHNTEEEWTANDITTVSDDDLRLFRGRVDVICGGFPCQAFSVAGKRKGFEDTRGTLFFEIARFANIIRPKYLFMENVKGLLNHDGGNTFRTILGALDELGYDAEWQVCNSKDFGVPQNRERVFIIGHLRGESTRKVFPVGDYSKQIDSQHREISKENEVYGFETSFGGSNGSPVFKEYMRCLDQTNSKGVLIKEATKKGYAEATVGDSINFSVPGSETRRGRVGKGVANTLDTSCNQGTIVSTPKLVGGIGEINFGKQFRQGNRVYDSNAVAMCLNAQPVGNAGGNSYLYQVGYRIRKLTPRECWRLQGFPDWAFDKAAAVNSDSQLYKQAGNSVTVNVIYEIAKRLGVDE